MITKFIEPWILFPGNLILLLLVTAFFVHRGVTRHGRGDVFTGGSSGSLGRRVIDRLPVVVLVGSAVVLYAASTDIVDRILLGSLERSVSAHSADEYHTAEAVVVLGGGIIDNAPSEVLINRLDASTDDRGNVGGPGAALSTEAESRLLYAYRISQRLDLPIVVTGGRVLSDESVPTEAQVARSLLLELGVPAHRILIEDESRTTAENASITRDRFGFDRVVLVTSAYHMPRSLCAFTREGVTPLPAPAAYRTDRRPIGAVHVMPNASALYNTSTFLRETIGRFYYTLRYGRCPA